MSILSSRQAILLASVSFVGLAASGNLALANPEGGTVEAGSATIGNADKNTLEINQQSQRAIINWDSFSIGEGETTRFILPNSQSVTLNRDLGGARSEIHGNIESNGRFFLVNPNGILFGPGSRVDVAGLVATTHDIRSQDFMAGRYEFNIPGQPDASVITQGEVSIQDLGFGAFVAPHVRNEGVIAARMGRVELASASGFTLDMHGDRLISFLVENPNEHQIFDAHGNPVSALVENTGEVIADGGVVAMSASAARGAVDSVINTDGIVQANTVEQRGGKIILGGGSTGAVRTSGQVQARGENPGERGGQVEVTGEAVIAERNSDIDASGMDGGGTILFGGDYLGGNTTNADILHLGITIEEEEIPTSRFAFVDDGARMSVDALDRGDGGKLIVWSDEATLSFGDLSARGGPLGGDGGFIETSGEYLEVAGEADASAPAGRAGTWLLDPMNIAIDDMTNGRVDISFGESFQLSDGGSYLGTGFRPTDNTAIVSASMIEGQLNLGTSVVVTTFGTVGPGMGDIFLRRDITKTSGGDARFVLAAEGAVLVSAGVNVRSFSGALTFELFAPETGIQAGNMGQIRLNGGDLNLTFRDFVSLTTPSGMDGQVNLNHANVGVGSGRVDLRFGQNRVNYRYSNNHVEYRTGAIDLNDRSSQGLVRMNFQTPVDVRLHNFAFAHNNRHGWEFNNTTSIGVVSGNALDGIPEFIGTDNLFLSFGSEPPGGAVPVIEASTDYSERVGDYRVTAPSGQAILDAHLASLRPRAPVEQVVQQAAEPAPVAPTPVPVPTAPAPYVPTTPLDGFQLQVLSMLERMVDASQAQRETLVNAVRDYWDRFRPSSEQVSQAADIARFIIEVSERIMEIDQEAADQPSTSDEQVEEVPGSQFLNRREELEVTRWLQEKPSRSLRNQLRDAGIVLDGTDAILGQVSPYGIPWIDVFGAYLATEKALENFQNGDFVAGLNELSKFGLTQALASSPNFSGAIAGLKIGGLLGYGVDRYLRGIARGQNRRAILFQIENYAELRNNGYSHEDILQNRSISGTTQYDSSGFISLTTRGTTAFQTRIPSLEDFSPEMIFDLARIEYEAEDDLRDLSQQVETDLRTMLEHTDS